MNLGAFGKYITLFRLAESAVADVLGDPTKLASAIAAVQTKVQALKLEIEGIEHEISAAVELAFSLFPHTAAPIASSPAPGIAPTPQIP